jgi:hypothetical protein
LLVGMNKSEKRERNTVTKPFALANSLIIVWKN